MAHQDLAACAMLLLLVAALFHTLPGGHWRGDDPALLLHALRSPGLAAFTDPAHWQQLSPSNLTPWVTLSFKLDLALGGLGPDGLVPRVFYLHQLVATGALALAAHALARQWLPPAWAALVGVLGLVGAPTAAVVEMLMTRHYLEGGLFALLALLGFVRATRQRHAVAALGWALAGALAYALACTAKEVYVPLVLVLAGLSCVLRPAHTVPARRGPALRQRAALLLPFVVVAALYVPWRWHMLGHALGGYGQAQGLLSADTWALWAAALARFGPWLLGPGWPLLPVLLGACGGLLVLRRRAAAVAPLVLALAVAACVLLPLLPLARTPGLTGPDRYLFLPWWVLSAALVAALRMAAVLAWPDERRRALAGLPLGLALAATAALQAAAVAPPRAAMQREFDALGRFLASPAQAHSAFVPPAHALASYWYVASLCEIQRLRGAACPQALIPGWPPQATITRLYAYDPAAGAMADASGQLDDERRRAAALDTARPLSVSMRLEAGWAHWRFGPRDDGQYYIVSPELGRYPLPASGQLRTSLTDVQFQVHHQAADGRTTASPTLRVRPGAPVQWSR